MPRPRDFEGKQSGLAYASDAASAALTNSTTETTLDTFTFQADELAKGDSLDIVCGGIATATNSTDTLQIKVKVGGTVVGQTSAVDVANDDIWVLHLRVHIRTDGPSGTMISMGIQQLGVEGTATMRQELVASTALDTTAAVAVIVTGTWSVASTSNSCRNEIFEIDHKRARTSD